MSRIVRRQIFLGLGLGLALFPISAKPQPPGREDKAATVNQVPTERALITERCQTIALELEDYEDNSRLVFERFCESLYQKLIEPRPTDPTANTPSSYDELPQATLPGRQPSPSGRFVRCLVEGDPDWIGFRILTREQCTRVGGEELAQND